MSDIKRYAPELVKRETDTRATRIEIGKSSRIDDEVIQDQRQQDDNDLQDGRQDQPKEEEVEPRRCKRARTEKLFRPNFVSFMVENKPTSYREAKYTWELVGLLSGCKPLGYKWIFKKKMKADGTIDKYKEGLDEITYVKEKWGRFEGNCGGAIPKSSCSFRLVLMTITGMTMRT
nr:gibberellin 3-beta-dioxygenase 1 [Tanacetum cinerariifolium]